MVSEIEMGISVALAWETETEGFSARCWSGSEGGCCWVTVRRCIGGGGNASLGTRWGDFGEEGEEVEEEEGAAAGEVVDAEALRRCSACMRGVTLFNRRGT